MTAGPRVSTQELENWERTGMLSDCAKDLLDDRRALASLRAQNERLREAHEKMREECIGVLEQLRDDNPFRGRFRDPIERRADDLLNRLRALASTDTGETHDGGTT